MKAWRIPLGISLTGTLLWWTHRLLTDAFPPFDNAFDTALWIICSILKALTLVIIPLVIGRVFSHCDRNLANTAKAVAVWGMALILLMSVLSAVRDPLLHRLNNDVSKFYPTSLHTPVGEHRYDDSDLPEQVARWQSGRTFATEAGMIVVSILLLGAIGFFAGRWGFFVDLGAAIFVGLLWLYGGQLLGLFLWTYDFFYAGAITGPVGVDLTGFFQATDPESEIAFLVYTTVIWSSWLLDTYLLREPIDLVDAHLPLARLTTN